MRKITFICFIASIAFVAMGVPESEEVKKLTGYYDFSSEFKMYSGYLTLQNDPLIANHYLFITSKGNP